MIHKVMEEFYVFVSCEDSLEHFGDYSGGQFRAQFPRTYPMKDKWECALLNVSFVPAFETPTIDKIERFLSRDISVVQRSRPSILPAGCRRIGEPIDTSL
jgi:hypothetical protein